MRNGRPLCSSDRIDTRARRGGEAILFPSLFVLLPLLSLLLLAGCTGSRCVRPTALGNLGSVINSDDDDYAPVLRDTSTLIFTSSRLNTRDAGLLERFGTRHLSHLFVSVRLTAEWDSVQPYEPAPGLGAAEAATLSLAVVPNRIGALGYYASCERTDGEGGCDIVMVVEREGTPLTMPSDLNSAGWDGYPHATGDGRRLYFVSDRSGGYGGTDIWYVEQETSGLWGAPRNAGGVVNGAGDEQSPFLDVASGDLYLAAADSAGNLDLHVIRSGGDRREALPAPFNSEGGELTPFIIGDLLYLASDRPGGCGGYDLYAFPIGR
jgi:hypothetical protein